MNNIALITGCLGQDGTYLAEMLLQKGYEVHGLIRRTSQPNPRLKYLEGVTLHEGDITDAMSIHRIIDEVCPTEIYNLAAQSHVGTSFDMPEYTMKVNAGGLLNVLEAVRQDFPKCRVYQASTSELYGKALETPQNENTPFNPISPYAVSKLHAHETAKYYREYYNIFVSCGILFNHESPRRGDEFVTQKIIKAAVRIAKGEQEKLELGDLSPKRDWGDAREYVEAMWLMLQDTEPGDYVIATGETHSVRDFVQIAFRMAGLKDYRKYVVSTEANKRPAEVMELKGDNTKFRKRMGWHPKTDIKELIKDMIETERNGEERSYYWECGVHRQVVTPGD
jgi:GDPmannose 4,6-dehydratase